MISFFLGVVVIDDIYGEAVDDHEFSPENEGFQEVTSKKALKLKQKAQQEAELKKQITEKQKKDAHNKVPLIGHLDLFFPDLFKWFSRISF